jgi:hypothetical protein
MNRWVRVLLSDQDEMLCIGDSAEIDCRALCKDLQEATGHRWTLSRVLCDRTRWCPEKAINRALAYAARA